MKMNLSGFTVSCDVPVTIDLTASEKNGVSLFTFSLGWDPETLADATSVTVSWQRPMLDHMYCWTPSRGLSRKVLPDWAGEESSMVSKSAPVSCIFDGRSRAQYVWALDECQKLVFCKNGVIEENGEMLFAFRLPLKQYTAASCTKVTLRADERGLSFAEALGDVVRWWEKDCGMTPASVPDTAKAPVYSFWYSFHQNVIAAEVEKECRRAKKLGFDICIIDDGWQTDDNSRGYAFCGDWEACPAKIPDMAAHVRAVHDIGMKYILWYSVPFVGYYSDHYDHFKDMLLYKRDNLNTGVLDPRYKEVREFLVNIYKKALLDWNPDGFKLDFIDSWFDSPENAPYNEKMDIPSLQDAVRIFMTTVMQELKSVKSDILLEFRQNYIGPHMRTFGNMFRVADCPGDYLSNRVGIFDLRMLMGNSAVHSDMLMWHQNETVEMDALQIISIMFGVMQYSACLHQQSSRVKKMSKFWLDFLSAHKKTLLDGKLRCYEPHLLYTWAQSTSDEECIAAVYSADKCISPKALSAVYLANGSNSNRILVEMEGVYQVSVFNCCGEETECFIRDFRGINTLDVPVGGIAVLKSDCTANVQNEKTTIPAKR